MKTRLYLLHSLTPLHVGIGQSIGAVDLPIMRERSTQLPIVPGSTLKGVLRDTWAQQPASSAWAEASRHLVTLMGPDTKDSAQTAHASALAFGDARTLLLPVRSLAGVAAWITCPFVLRRYQRDAALLDLNTPTIPSPGRSALVAKSNASVCFDQSNDRPKILVEDLVFEAVANDDVAAWARHLAEMLQAVEGPWSELLPNHLVVLPDDEFAFMAETATEVRARVRIDDRTRVVDEGALWYEENLPAETVLWGVIGVGPSRRPDDHHGVEKINSWLPAKQRLLLQVGGKQTVGRGLCQWTLV